MPPVAGDAARRISAPIAQRWQETDPLLPAPEPPPPGCGAPLTVTRSGGQPAAIGSCEHWVGTAESVDTAWGTRRRFQLTTAVAGPDVGRDLDGLLALWRDHLAATPGTDDDDSSAVVTWPSRDIEGVAALVRRGLCPMAIVAARVTGRDPGGPADGAPRPAGAAAGPGPASGTAARGVAVRRAGPTDIDAVARLGLEVIRYDAHFGNGGVRPGTTQAMRGEAAGLLAGPQPWTWLAERDGEPVGLLSAQRPEAAGWIAPMARPGTAAYLMLMFVRAGLRGSGIGAEMVARLHQEVGAAGVPVTLLHYQLLNPLSAPFWSQQGYRPLWTTWEARPARAIR
jgi:GNAT superfamily N-acetyltransferase